MGKINSKEGNRTERYEKQKAQNKIVVTNPK